MPRLRAAAVAVAGNYVPHVRVLAESLARHQPDVRLTVLVVDAYERPPGAAPDEPFDQLWPADIGMAEREVHRRAMLYDTQGLISSLKPHLAEHLLAQGADSVLIIDADTLVLAPIGDLFDLARDHGVLLSPHLVAPPTRGHSGDWPEEELLLAGVFNGGLVGVGRTGDAFLRWLQARVARDCVLDFARGLVYSQRWLDLVPGLFEHHVLRDAGVNVLMHRLETRDLDEGPSGALAFAGAPLRIMHFTGFEPSDPGRLCRYFDDVRASLQGRPQLAALCERYATLLRERGWPANAPEAWQRLPGGPAVDEVMRALYRRELLAAECDERSEPPDPFDPGSADEFLRWLQAPVDAGEESTGVSRYLGELHRQRADLREAFPDVPGPDSAGLRRWAVEKLQTGSPEVDPRLLAGVSL